MSKLRTQPNIADEVKKRAIMAMFSDDELMDRLVLKGGNLLDIIYKVSPRASLDVDLSTDGDLGDTDALKSRIEKVLRTTFREIGYEVFDVSVEEEPQYRLDEMADFWGGYKVRFKIIEQARFKQLADNPENLRRNAASVGKRGSTRFQIDISKHEYCESKQACEFEHLTIYCYTPLMVVCEKLRAICQQMPVYADQMKRHSSARARDFVDIYVVANQCNVDLTGDEIRRMLPKVFDAKRVPLRLLEDIHKFRDYHRQDFESLRATVKAGFQLHEFDFYFDYVLNAVDQLKTLWYK
jgi:predicted nucleotidyltransferase component of viral defense system